MALTVAKAATETAGLVSDRRLCEDARGNPVEANDPKAAFLVVAGPGDTIAERHVRRLGLRVEDGRITWGIPAVAMPVIEISEPTEEPASEVMGAPKPRGRRRARKEM